MHRSNACHKSRSPAGCTFNAAHRVHNPALSDEENKALFGKCNNPNWHGHNYTLDVSVTGPVDEQHRLRHRSRRAQGASSSAKSIDKVDHKNFNLEVDFMHGLIPTTENIVVGCGACSSRRSRRPSSRGSCSGRRRTTTSSTTGNDHAAVHGASSPARRAASDSPSRARSSTTACASPCSRARRPHCATRAATIGDRRGADRVRRRRSRSPSTRMVDARARRARRARPTSSSTTPASSSSSSAHATDPSDFAARST